MKKQNIQLPKTVTHYQTGQINDREVVATFGDRAILQTPVGSREEWKRSRNYRSHLMVVDGDTYEYAGSVIGPVASYQMIGRIG